MWDAIIGLFSNIFGTVQGLLGIESKRIDLKNSADVKSAAEAQSDAQKDDASNKAIADKNTDQVRKDLAE